MNASANRQAKILSTDLPMSARAADAELIELHAAAQRQNYASDTCADHKWEWSNWEQITSFAENYHALAV
jgi:hypothetical protein